MFIAALFTINKTGKQPKCPVTNEWVKNMLCVYTHTHAHTQCLNITQPLKNEIRPFAAKQMELEMITLSQSDKDKYCMKSLICGI